MWLLSSGKTCPCSLCFGEGVGGTSSQGAIVESSLTGADDTSTPQATPLLLTTSSVSLTVKPHHHIFV